MRWKKLMLKIFESAYMLRWNGMLYPMEFVELDKQAHKMFIAYFIGKFEESKNGFSWMKIIEGSLFELLHTITITNIKPVVLSKIKADDEKYKLLNEYVFKQVKPYLYSFSRELYARFTNYFSNSQMDINKKVLSAAHIYSSEWEFNIIRNFNSSDNSITNELNERINAYRDLEGVKKLYTDADFSSLIDICGRLRFHRRWASLYRIPEISVLGHSYITAIIAYLLSLELGGCGKRCYNNFFSALFHDLPEIFTNDIISPVKRSVSGLEKLIGEVETNLINENFYPLVPDKILPEMKMFLENVFGNYVMADNNVFQASSNEISNLYNFDRFNPKDGELVRTADEMSALLEAAVAVENGSSKNKFSNIQRDYRNVLETKNIEGLNFESIIEGF